MTKRSKTRSKSRLTMNIPRVSLDEIQVQKKSKTDILSNGKLHSLSQARAVARLKLIQKERGIPRDFLDEATIETDLTLNKMKSQHGKVEEPTQTPRYSQVMLDETCLEQKNRSQVLSNGTSTQQPQGGIPRTFLDETTKRVHTGKDKCFNSKFVKTFVKELKQAHADMLAGSPIEFDNKVQAITPDVSPDIKEMVDNAFNTVVSFEKADSKDTDMFLFKIANTSYEPCVFGDGHKPCSKVSWSADYHALFCVNDDTCTMLTIIANSVYRIVSMRQKPTECQMLSAMGHYTGYNAVAGTVQAAADIKSNIDEVGKTAKVIQDALPDIHATLDSIRDTSDQVNDALPTIKKEVKEVGSTFKKWGNMTDDLRSSIATIVPSVVEAVRQFLKGALTVGKYSLAALVIIGVFKLLKSLLEMLSVEKQKMVLKIVGSGLVIAGLAGAAYQVAGQHLINFAERLTAEGKRAKGHWDDARDDCFPEFENLKRITRLNTFGVEIKSNSGVRVKRSQPMFRFTRLMHTVRRELFDLYERSKAGERFRILFNAIFYVDSPGIAPEQFQRLQQMVLDGASNEDVVKELESNEDYFKMVAFSNIKEAKEALGQSKEDDDHVKAIIDSSRSLGDKLGQISLSMFGKFKSVTNIDSKMDKEMDLEQQVKDGLELQGFNRDGPNSLMALLYVLLRKYQHPEEQWKNQFDTLRKESNNMKVLTSATECVWDLLPNYLRVSAYEAFGMGQPTDVSKEVVELLCACHQMLGDIVIPAKRTSAFKQNYLTRYRALQQVMMDESFYTKKEGFTYALLTSAFTKMSDKAKLLDDVSDSSGHRIQTIGIWIEGIPGIGKSRIIDALANRFAPDYPVDNRVHTWHLNEQFMSGYNKQWAVDADDVGSNPLALAQIGFFQDLLTKVSTKKTTVVKAFEKGGLWDTHCLGLSSNTSMMNILGIQVNQGVLTNPEAIVRRFSGRTGMRVIMKPADAKFTKLNADNKIVGNGDAITAQSSEDSENFAHAVFEIDGKDYSFDGFCARFGVLYKGAMEEYAKELNKDQAVRDCRYTRFVRNLRKEYKIDMFPDELQSGRGWPKVGAPKTTKGKWRKPIRQLSAQKQPKAQQQKPAIALKDKSWKVSAARQLKKQELKEQRPAQRFNRNLANFLHNTEPDVLKRKIAEAKEKGDTSKFEFQGADMKAVRKNDNDVMTTYTRLETELAVKHESKSTSEELLKAGLAINPDKQLSTNGKIKVLENAEALMMESESDDDKTYGALNIVENSSFLPVWNAYVDTKWKSLKSTIDSALAKVANVNWLELAKHLSPVLQIIGAIGMAYKAIQWFREDSHPKHEGDHYHLGASSPVRFSSKPGDDFYLMGAPASYARDGSFLYRPNGKSRNHGHRFTRNRNRDKRNPTMLNSSMELCKSDFSNLPDCSNLLSRCMVKFSNTESFDSKKCGWATFIQDKHMLLNRHFVTGREGMVFGNVFAFELQGIVFRSVFNECDVRIVRDIDGTETDLIIWRVQARNGSSVLSTPNLLKHFQWEDDVKRDYWHTDKVPIHVMSNYLDEIDTTQVVKAQATDSKNWKLRYADSTKVTSDRALLYSGNFKRGDCGKLVIKGKIIGVHVAGKPGVLGTAQVVTRGMLETSLTFQSAMDVPMINEMSHLELPDGSYLGERSDMRGVPTSGDFIPFASVPKPVIMSHRTRLVRTGMVEAGSEWAKKCSKVPAILGVNDPRYNGTASMDCQFLADRMDRYAVRPPDLPAGLLDAAVSKLVSAVPPGPAPVRVWEVGEALNPRHMSSILEPIPRSTGAGWGFTGKGKYEQIGFDEATDTYFAKGELVTKMKRVHELLKKGCNPLFIYSEFPKDEILKPSKIESKCCRTISGSPLDFTVLSKQVFGAFIDSWQRIPLQWGHANGLDVLSQDWDSIIRKMKRISHLGFDSDFKKFDSTMSKQFMVSFWKHVDQWYKAHGQWSPESSFMRWVVIYNMVHSKHIIGRSVFIKMMGLPSGSLLTTIMNCFWARTLLLVGYALLAPDSEDRSTVSLSFHGYDQTVKTFVLGDDNFSAVSKQTGKWFNAKALGQALGKYNIVITPATKHATLSSSNRPIEDLEFLACTTRVANEIPGWKYYPVIKEGSLTKAISYARVKDDYPLPVALDSNIYMSLERLFCSGRERFNEFYTDVVGTYTRMYPEAEVEFPTYDVLLLKHRVDDEFLTEPELVHFDPPEGMGLILMSTMDMPVSRNIATGYDNPVSMESKATAIGVQPIKGMPIVDTPQTLRVLLRRNYAVAIEASGHVKDFLWINIGSLFGTKKASPDQVQTPLSKIGAWFRLWSGPVHVVAYSEQALSLSYLPGVHTTPNSGAGIFDTAIPANAVAYGGGYNFSPKSVGFVNAKLPFTSVYHSLKIPHYDDDIVEENNTGAAILRTDDRNEKVSLTCTTGDDFDMGVRYLVPRIRVASWNLAPDSYPTQLQGITVSKSNYNISDVQSSGVEMNPTSTTETSSDTKIDARAGNDAPNVSCQLASVLRQTSVYGSSAQRVNFDPGLTITNEMQAADMSTANTHDVMPLSELVKPTFSGGVSWNTSQVPGTVLMSGLISPSDNVTNLVLGSDTQHTALSTVSTMYGYWRGPYKKGFSVVTSGVHVGRLGFACLYGQTTPPVGLEELTSQRYSIFEINSESNVHVVEIPYVSTKRVLETYHGQTDVTTYSTGVWALFVMNSLRAPAAASTTVDVLASEGGADGLQFIVPFANNRTLSFGYASPPLARSLNTFAVDPVLELKEPEDDEEVKMELQGMRFLDLEFQSDMDVPVSSGEEKVGVVMADQTVTNAANHDSDPGTSDIKIVRQPFLNYVDMLSRNQWVANFGWTTSQNPMTSLYSRPVPFGMLTNTAARAMNSFRQVKTTAVVTAKLTASAFHAGRLILVSLPMTTQAQMDAVLTNRTIVTYPNHAFLDAGASTSVEFRIPFQYFKAYLSKGENYGLFQIRIFTPLRVGAGGSGSVTVTLYVRFEETELRVIEPS